MKATVTGAVLLGLYCLLLTVLALATHTPGSIRWLAWR
jgi:hypothetical protein